MTIARTLSAVGLIRPGRRRGFCPACRLWSAGPASASVEIAPPALTALVFLAVAGIAWWFVVQQSRTMGGMEMEPGTPVAFAAGWAVMMTAMMLPSAIPILFAFARDAEGRRGWQAATGVLGLTYLSAWLGFGLVCYLVLNALPAPLPNQAVAGGVALALAGLYGLTPIKRASEARCRELCALHGSLPFNLMRSALVVGARYGRSCLGCSVAVMVAMAVIGMTSLGWIVILSGVVLVYKLAPAPSTGRTLLLSAALCVLGVAYGLTP